MIIHTGMRTDIPAFYSKWLANRLREGYVLVRTPFNPTAVTRYELDPSVVDIICFCTKNPAPMLQYMELLAPYPQYWFVTITPYSKDIEPRVPPYERVIEDFIKLSEIVGTDCVGWRYDPILLDEEWTIERHLAVFEKMAARLSGHTEVCVISFIDLYDKVRRNYPEARSVPTETQLEMTRALVEIGRRYGLTIRPCGESARLAETGADCRGCMTVEVYEQAIGARLHVPPNPNNRRECACYLTGDIGAYNTCGHLCRYCYANADADLVRRNMSFHDPNSPLLIGHLNPEDVVHQAKQISWVDRQIRMRVD